MSFLNKAEQFIWEKSPIGRASGWVEGQIYGQRPSGAVVNTSTYDNKNVYSLGANTTSNTNDVGQGQGFLGSVESQLGKVAGGIENLGAAAASPVTPLVLGIGAVALIALLVKF